MAAVLVLTFAALGWLFGNIRYVVTVAALLATVAVALALNGGWSRNGWGDFGPTLNALAAIACLTGAALGTAARKLSSG